MNEALGAPLSPPPWHVIINAVRAALDEDLGIAGDITTAALVDPDATARAQIAFRDAGVLAGTWTTEATCAQFDLMCAWQADDGDELAAGAVAGELEGSLADMLTAERTILNFLTHLSGVATLTRAFVTAAGPGLVVRDTRKTLPGLRALEKAAVRAGGGVNHRMGLYDAILVKDNHLEALDAAVGEVVEAARAAYPAVFVEVEAETPAAAQAAAAAGADLVLLDNMTPQQAKQAVDAIAGECPAEISGGITLDNVAGFAQTGAEYVAVGAITHSAPSIDIGIDLIESADQ